MGLPLESFSSIQEMDMRQANYRMTTPKIFEMNQIKFRPNSDTFRGVFRLPGTPVDKIRKFKETRRGRPR